MSESEQKYGSGSGSIRCYVVEARCCLHRPQVLTSGEVLDSTWRQIQFPRMSPIGVRVELFNRMAESEGYLDFSAANALAWWFLSNAQEQRSSGIIMRAIGVETRLVQVEFSYSFSAKERGVGTALTQRDERDSNITPRDQPTSAQA